MNNLFERLRGRLIRWRKWLLVAMILCGCLLALNIAARQLNSEIERIGTYQLKGRMEVKQKTVDGTSKTHTDKILLEVCDENIQCFKDLKAIAIMETNLNPNRIGDGGKSYGMFQIHRGYHPDITIEQARDIHWSATWTYKRLIAYGYPEYRTRAIQAHNGLDKNNGYAQKVIAISNKL